MFKLQNTLNALNDNTSANDNFSRTFKTEVAGLDHSLLPLQKGLSQSSYVSNESVNAVVLSTSETAFTHEIKVSIFYTGIIAGCSCSDDPTPLDTQNEQCDMLFSIDKLTAETTAELL
ncbi:MAG TPA: hypothetical protein ENJ08_13150 [Gammaproteobacteria bacterium]|nr:hypothetical protein [Gammaproteobacteria bacterium]